MHQNSHYQGASFEVFGMKLGLQLIQTKATRLSRNFDGLQSFKISQVLYFWDWIRMIYKKIGPNRFSNLCHLYWPSQYLVQQ